MDTKRPIDRKREAGGMMDIGMPNDPGPIKLVFAAGGTFLAIKEKGIYAIKLADEIDPGRTNPDIPNAYSTYWPTAPIHFCRRTSITSQNQAFPEVTLPSGSCYAVTQ
jgi:hypothetical protein